MSRIHSTLIALLAGATATAAVAAAIHTVPLGQKVAAAPSISAHDLAARQAKLAAWRRSLHATLAKHPPKLPKLPHFAPVPVAAATSAAQQAAQPRVTYVRPKTVVKYERAPAPTTTTTTIGSDDDGSEDSSGDDGGSGGGD